MIENRQTSPQSQLQTISICVVSVLVFIVLFFGVRSYEERVAVQAIRLAIEHRVDEVNYELAGEARDIETLWQAYGPQQELTEEEFYSLADPIVQSHHTFLPLLIALMGGGLAFVMLGMWLNMSGRTRTYHKVIKSKELELQQSQEKLASLVVSDDLTGLANDRHFSQMLNTECRRAVREFSPLTLMLINADKIEGAEDSSARQKLCQIATILESAISRPGDLAARIGDHRFALLLPATNEQSPVLAERLCQEVREAHTEGEALSISIGTCTMQPSVQLTAENILASVEVALNDAVANGGDQVRARTEDPRDIPVTFSN
ncbi:GGDEF domain-containing protein [Amphritea japonica]|uniref:diguanylate cyclase n=1 Tax=Amphritea japonica ATCC BAA-1530 TaxID=1278309 RepID=A0A7R6STG3_9GAMM|nr:GGDEF domain-containing protein [Amphritea japonica]BBB26655.1 signal transduction protein [Amphritea japonica ATCC BAA-1530]